VSGPSLFIKVLNGWRSDILTMIANWMSNRPGLNVGYSWLWSMIVPVDVELELTLQGVNDWAPGSPNASPTALPYIGNSRGIIRGEAETDDHYAARLQKWRTITKSMGQSERLALEIQNYLANTPTVRVIERIYSTSGAPQALYVTALPDGSTHLATAAWSWDETSGWTDDTTSYPGSQTRTFWSDLWIVVSPCEWPITGTQLSALVPIWGSTSVGLGHAVPVVARDAILRIVGQWKGAHCFVRALIWSYDATLFDPASPAASGDPDGTFGPLPNRTGHADGRVRYWEPQGG
jgi:hypothetical protein